jgi:DNA modification methylase
MPLDTTAEPSYRPIGPPDVGDAERYVIHREPDGVMLRGDNEVILPLLPPQSIHVAVTSPPYNASIEKFTASGFMKEKAMKAWIDKMANGYHDSIDEASYHTLIVTMLNNVARVLVDDGSVWFNHKLRWRNKRLLHPYTMVSDSVLHPRSEIIWRRGMGIMQNARMPFLAEERVYWLTKDPERWQWNQEAVVLGNVWDIAPASGKHGHPCVFPEKLVANCLNCVAQPGHVVMDPFAGTGTVGRVAKKFGCRYVLIERDPMYCDIIIEGLRQDALPGMFQ